MCERSVAVETRFLRKFYRFRPHLRNIRYSVSPVTTAGDVSTTEFVACFYFKLRSVTTVKKEIFFSPKRRLISALIDTTIILFCWRRKYTELFRNYPTLKVEIMRKHTATLEDS